jgi:predicted nucleotidyltransferase
LIFGSLARGEATDESDMDVKVVTYEDIIDHILEPLGGRQPIAENKCDCPFCRVDLALVVGAWVGV